MAGPGYALRICTFALLPFTLPYFTESVSAVIFPHRGSLSIFFFIHHHLISRVLPPCFFSFGSPSLIPHSHTHTLSLSLFAFSPHPIQFCPPHHNKKDRETEADGETPTPGPLSTNTLLFGLWAPRPLFCSESFFVVPGETDKETSRNE